MTLKNLGSFLFHLLKKVTFASNNFVCMLVFAIFGAAAMACLAVTMGIQGVNTVINRKLGEKCDIDDWMTVIEEWWGKK